MFDVVRMCLALAGCLALLLAFMVTYYRGWATGMREGRRAERMDRESEERQLIKAIAHDRDIVPEFAEDFDSFRMRVIAIVRQQPSSSIRFVGENLDAFRRRTRGLSS